MPELEKGYLKVVSTPQIVRAQYIEDTRLGVQNVGDSEDEKNAQADNNYEQQEQKQQHQNEQQHEQQNEQQNEQDNGDSGSNDMNPEARDDLWFDLFCFVFRNVLIFIS